MTTTYDNIKQALQASSHKAEQQRDLLRDFQLLACSDASGEEIQFVTKVVFQALLRRKQQSILDFIQANYSNPSLSALVQVKNAEFKELEQMLDAMQVDIQTVTLHL